MVAEVDFLAFATGVGADVEAQDVYVTDPVVTAGCSVGIFNPSQYNKISRQGNFFSAILANLIAEITGASVLDDGNLAGKMQQMWQAWLQSSLFSDVGSPNAYLVDNPSSPIGITFTVPALGQRISLLIATGNTNTGASTLDWCGVNTSAIHKTTGALDGGELLAGRIIDLEYDGTYWQLIAGSASGIGTYTFEAYLASTTLVVPVNVTRMIMLLWGGGGGGGGGNGSLGGSGGGAGLFALGIMSVTPGATLTITIGAGGAGATTNVAGSNGGTTSVSESVVGTLITAGAGAGGPPGGGNGGSGGTVSSGSQWAIDGGGGFISSAFGTIGSPGGSSPLGGYGGMQGNGGGVPGGGGCGNTSTNTYGSLPGSGGEVLLIWAS